MGLWGQASLKSEGHAETQGRDNVIYIWVQSTGRIPSSLGYASLFA